jgi:hypothetical protein
MREKIFRPELIDKSRGREKHYPLGMITIVYRRRSKDFVLEDGKVKVDSNSKLVLVDTTPRDSRKIEAYATTNPRITSY